MKLTKSMLAAGVITTVAAGSLLGLGTASAQSNASSTSLIDKIATKFNISRDEVATVFEEEKEARHAEMEAKRSEQLQSLVDDGTITAEQKTALEAKHAEMKAARDALKDQDLTREEMRTKMDEARTAFEAWAEAEGIDLDAIRPERGMGGPGGRHGGPRGMNDAPSDSDDTTQDQ